MRDCCNSIFFSKTKKGNCSVYLGLKNGDIFVHCRRGWQQSMFPGIQMLFFSVDLGTLFKDCFPSIQHIFSTLLALLATSLMS